MARITNRNFLPGFQDLEIEYGPDQRGPDVSDDIQMVYLMGDATPDPAISVASFVPGWSLPDPIPIEYAAQILIFNVVAQFTRLELIASAGGNGLWVYSLHTDNAGNNNIFIWSNAAASGLATTINPTAANSSAWGAGVAATAVLDAGNTATVAPTNAMYVDMSISSVSGRPEAFTGGFEPIYISAGRVFVMQTIATNKAMEIGVSWREVA